MDDQKEEKKASGEEEQMAPHKEELPMSTQERGPHEEQSSPQSEDELPLDFTGRDEEFFVEDLELKSILEREEQKNERAPSEEIAAELEEAPSTTEKSAGPSTPRKTSSKAQVKVPEPPLTPTQPITSLQEIPLSLGVELTRFTLPLSDVAKWTTGYEFSLQQPPSTQVNLVINGQRVAQGELIQIGEYWGVRVTSIDS